MVGGAIVTRAQVQADVDTINERLAQAAIHTTFTVDIGGVGDPGVPMPAGPGCAGNWSRCKNTALSTVQSAPGRTMLFGTNIVW